MQLLRIHAKHRFIFAQPQQLELTISTPQPRMHEIFQVSIDAKHVRANIFKSFAGKLRGAESTMSTDDRIILNVTATRRGTMDLGPLTFALDKTVYTTNKVTVEVIEELPNTNKGLWFRKVNTGQDSFAIIIEQRIPASRKTEISDNTTKPWLTQRK